jgi:hypothetical protein
MDEYSSLMMCIVINMLNDILVLAMEINVAVAWGRVGSRDTGEA